MKHNSILGYVNSIGTSTRYLKKYFFQNKLHINTSIWHKSSSVLYIFAMVDNNNLLNLFFIRKVPTKKKKFHDKIMII